MAIFGRKATRELGKGTLRYLVSRHKMVLANLCRDYRCVEKKFVLGTGSLIRVFRLSDAKESGVIVLGWDTLEVHPELVVFDGFLMGKGSGDASLDRIRP